MANVIPDLTLLRVPVDFNDLHDDNLVDTAIESCPELRGQQLGHVVELLEGSSISCFAIIESLGEYLATFRVIWESWRELHMSFETSVPEAIDDMPAGERATSISYASDFAIAA